MNKLKNKVAVVTGGNSGIGLASVRLFKEQGASVVIVGQNAQTLAAARQELGGDTLAVQANVALLADIKKVMAAVREKFGRIDILFANAGISHCPSIERRTKRTFITSLISTLKVFSLHFPRRCCFLPLMILRI